MVSKLKYLLYLLLIFGPTLLSNCKSSISEDELYGTWKYRKVEHPNANPPDSLSKDEIVRQSPSIRFLTPKNYLITWGGKTLSAGTFTLNGRNILIHEKLPGGSSRQFPFWVSELTDKEIVFETKGEDGSRVTAVKE